MEKTIRCLIIVDHNFKCVMRDGRISNYRYFVFFILRTKGHVFLFRMMSQKPADEITFFLKKVFVGVYGV